MRAVRAVFAELEAAEALLSLQPEAALEVAPKPAPAAAPLAAPAPPPPAASPPATPAAAPPAASEAVPPPGIQHPASERDSNLSAANWRVRTPLTAVLKAYAPNRFKNEKVRPAYPASPAALLLLLLLRPTLGLQALLAPATVLHWPRLLLLLSSTGPACCWPYCRMAAGPLRCCMPTLLAPMHPMQDVDRFLLYREQVALWLVKRRKLTRAGELYFGMGLLRVKHGAARKINLKLADNLHLLFGWEPKPCCQLYGGAVMRVKEETLEKLRRGMRATLPSAGELAPHFPELPRTTITRLVGDSDDDITDSDLLPRSPPPKKRGWA